MHEKLNPLSFDLFGELIDEAWKKEWQGMPEFVQEDLEPKYQIIVSFEDLPALLAFGELLDKKFTENTRSIWFPEAEIGRYADKRYFDES